MKMSDVYLAIYSIADMCLAPIETVVTLFTIKYCESSINIKLIPSKQELTEQAYMIDLTSFVYEIININEMPHYASSCELPNVTVNEDSCMAGLCTVLRQIVKSANPKYLMNDGNKLLGFKGSCLMACSEASIWTKFCEVDLILTLKSLARSHPEKSELPVSLARFECHMSQPVKLHNLYKYTMCKKFAALDISRRDETGLPEHTYAEGACITLSDIIIFVCMHILLNMFSSQMILKLVPLTAKWYDRMLADQFIIKCLSCLPLSKNCDSDILQYTLPAVVNESLYKSDPKRYKPKNRIYTRQEDIEHSLQLVEDMKISMQLDIEPFGKMDLNWSDIPFDATPEGGSLPPARLQRKQEQLQNLCKPVLKLAKAGNTIVDFCSGSGHLGILIAYLLPHCTIILLENKEESLNRAKKRVQKLKLTNVKFYQCNLDYFKGDFDIGTSLHACGLATDLVIQRCIQKNAIFISCPCCYGSLQDCHQLTYPRSDIFKGRFKNKEYSYLSHAADQTHDELNIKTKQGYKCMTIIDTDRKLFAEQFGYKVYLAKLVPETCTLKNHLLVGIPKNKLIHNNASDN
ncbi:glutathione S-transferase C-terminal domain-containing protein homolog [Pogonomyrmex barbatus]|uniref:Glutathione S-transferase C-terminal domain-containing protein homolog n=1 Tax=Pogonomyrmex barbatus TaxID=144034 RepID=A0A8N1SCL0_9HYME|nr:glutathione S-transferase C-terminal domain-containing protein homolog [Pogonomyrmex barbatus]